MQSASSRSWTLIAVSISDNDNHYTRGTSIFFVSPSRQCGTKVFFIVRAGHKPRLECAACAKIPWSHQHFSKKEYLRSQAINLMLPKQVKAWWDASMRPRECWSQLPNMNARQNRQPWPMWPTRSDWTMSPSYSCVHATTWMHCMVANKTHAEKAWWKLQQECYLLSWTNSGSNTP